MDRSLTDRPLTPQGDLLDHWAKAKCNIGRGVSTWSVEKRISNTYDDLRYCFVAVGFLSLSVLSVVRLFPTQMILDIY